MVTTETEVSDECVRWRGGGTVTALLQVASRGDDPSVAATVVLMAGGEAPSSES